MPVTLRTTAVAVAGSRLDRSSVIVLRSPSAVRVVTPMALRVSRTRTGLAAVKPDGSDALAARAGSPPLTKSRSVAVLMPGTLPVLLFCQRVQFDQPLGSVGEFAYEATQS